MYDNLIKLPGTATRLVFAVLAMFSIAHAAANECLNLFPYDVKEDGPPKICQSALTGTASNYSCQDYRSGTTRYRVLYKGGRTAKAVLAFKADGSEQVLSSPFRGDAKLNCPLNPPTGVPKYAFHRGMGVCRDDKNMPVACSVFHYAAARQPVARLYMVYYPHNAQHKVQIEVEDAGANDDAMVAELAYQLGRSLLETSCCSDQAMKYLAYAYHLFPRAEIYRHAYQRSRALLAFDSQ
jgi:hypothetical protein